MNASIITIGDEILIGQVLDTNSPWMAQKLNDIGISVVKKYCVSDTKDEILKALDEATANSNIILITGGLGPTKDDITKNTLTEYFRTELVFNEEVFDNVKKLFSKTNRNIIGRNKEQAMLPENCIPVPNRLGTAYGMWFELNEKIFVSMPGVPFEMKEMMEEHILKKLSKRFNSSVVYHKTVLTQGAGESTIAEIIEEWENDLPKSIKLAYLPKPGMVRLRLSGSDKDKLIITQIENETKKLVSLLGDLVFGYDQESLEEVLGKLLLSNGCTIGNR